MNYKSEYVYLFTRNDEIHPIKRMNDISTSKHIYKI